MSQLFQTCLAETLRWEGGFSNDPLDPGGPTNRGVTIAVFAAWRGVTVTPENRDFLVAELRAMSHADAAQIYRRQYWEPVGADQLPPPLALAVFDFAVNSGTIRAVRHLQAVLGCTVDGHIGRVTLTAAQQCENPLQMALLLNERRRAYLRKLSTFFRFGRGWLRRVDGIEAACRALAGPHADAGEPTVSGWTIEEPVAPLADRDAQSATQGRATMPDVAAGSGTGTQGASGVLVTGGSAQLGVDVAGAVAKVEAGGKSGLWHLALELAQRPSFWLAVAAIGGAAYVWLQQTRQRVTL